MARDNELRDKLIALARQLLNGTKSGKVAWAPTDDDNTFLCTGTRSSVTVELTVDRDGDAHVTLSILNSQGATVDSIKSEFTQIAQDEWQGEPWNTALEDLFYAARRSAYNVDDAIDSLLADIAKGISAPPQRKSKTEDPWANNGGYSDEPPF